MVRVSKKMIEAIVPMISALCHPKVRSLDAGLRVILRAAIDILNPMTSEARCAVSVKMAIEFARYPPINCAIMKKRDTKDTSFNFFIETK